MTIYVLVPGDLPSVRIEFLRQLGNQSHSSRGDESYHTRLLSLVVRVENASGVLLGVSIPVSTPGSTPKLSPDGNLNPFQLMTAFVDSVIIPGVAFVLALDHLITAAIIAGGFSVVNT